jgi:hypothetical protein
MVLVGYFNSTRVGPFHIFLPDGSSATAGTCEGYIGVSKVDRNVVSLDTIPFGSSHSLYAGGRLPQLRQEPLVLTLPDRSLRNATIVLAGGRQL